MVQRQRQRQEEKLSSGTRAAFAAQAEGVDDGRAHVVCLPYPLQGHIEPMMQLSKLLASRGARVTFVVTDFRMNRLKESTQQSIHKYNIALRSISDGLPPHMHSDPLATNYRVERVLAYDRNMAAPFSHLIRELNSNNIHSAPPVSFIVFDVALSWAHSVASELGIPSAALWTSGPSCYAAQCQTPLLISQGILPIRDISAPALESDIDVITSIPGLAPVFRLKDLPTFFLVEDVLNDPIFQTFQGRIECLRDAGCPVLMNTLNVLDPEVKELAARGTVSMPITPVGPLFFMDPDYNQSLQSNELNGSHTTTKNDANLCQEDQTSWRKWLDGRPEASVLYVSFGSIATLQPQQAIEFALGLQASQLPFLWAFRPDLIDRTGDRSESVDAVTAEVTQIIDRSPGGLLVPWVPQMHVLAHPAVGGFLTHCGWNSVLEAMWAGVPMLGFPLFAEQRMNCRMMERVWCVGQELLRTGNDGLATSHDVASHVTSLMQGVSLRLRCSLMREALHKGVGESSHNLNKFIERIMSHAANRLAS